HSQQYLRRVSRVEDQAGGEESIRACGEIRFGAVRPEFHEGGGVSPQQPGKVDGRTSAATDGHVGTIAQDVETFPIEDSVGVAQRRAMCVGGPRYQRAPQPIGGWRPWPYWS